MRDEFQRIEWAEPPMGDLVGEAVAQGRRMRTARRFRAGGAGLAVLVAIGLAAIPIVRSTGAPAPAGQETLVAAAPAPSSSAPAPVTARVKGTPAGLLKLLLDELPEGKTSHYAGLVESGDVSVQTFLDRGQGPGMIRLHVMTRPASAFSGAWTPLSGGAKYQVKSNTGNCVQQTIVWVHHADDTLLQFDLYGCPELDGRKMRPALTAREAAEVGADPRWGVKIDPALNRQGAAAFPHLPTEFDK
ncbi:hypothetical protein OWR29_24210 [Actinoplanes sp. Pm04-4]|uniref:Uncharacterized protein n=1 Tax=Paractinoplanes pyxinae TaxID=2997416 RepID=A0ABT4B3N2_9ACTN|nr:hypothetical protein [Actinoplanes pyxinae]MCY1141114.1 hypothetical protein [Actinoplanes pyxinae]